MLKLFKKERVDMNIRIKSLFIMFLLFFLTNTPSVMAITQKELKNTFVAASSAYTKKQYDTSIILSKRILKIDPKHYETLCLLGLAYGSKGDVDKSIETFVKAAKLYPNRWEANSFLGDIYMQQEAYYIAKMYYKNVVNNKTLPADGKVIYNKKLKLCEKMLERINDSKGPNINVVIPFNPSEWTIKGMSNDKNMWGVEYVYKNEDLKSWSKLVTIDCFKSPEFTLDEYYSKIINYLKGMAISLNKNFTYKLISHSENEIIYEWNTGNGEEAEISRLIKHGNEVYQLHYAQKSNITDKQREEWIRILKESKIIEPMSQPKAT